MINFSAGGSSVAKGESLKDTALTLQAMGADAIVIRHSSSGSPLQLTRWVDGHVLNAGDGTHEHPTQALLDLYTMREKLGRLEGLRVAIVGDVLHSRVARSLTFGLVKMGAEVTLVGPPTLIPPDAPAWGVQVSYDIDGVLPKLDVCYMLRVQRERQRLEYFPSVREYARLFGVDARPGAMLPEDALIMHPGPMNRGVEIDSDVADLPAVRDRGAGDERHRDPHGAAVPAARRRGRGGADERRASSSTGGRVVDPAAGVDEVRDVVVADGVIAGPEAAEGAERIDARRSRPRTRASSTCTRICASPARSTRRRSRPGPVRRRSAGTRRSRRWPTPSRSPTTPRSCRGARPGRRPRAAATSSRSARSRRGCAGESLAEMGEMVEAGVRVFSDDGHCVPDGAAAAQRACSTRRRSRTRSCSPSTPRTRRSSRAGTCTRALQSAALGLAGRPAEAEEIVVARDLAARARDRRAAASVPPVERAGVELVRRAKAEGVRVTAEVTPHHLDVHRRATSPHTTPT